MNWVLVSIGLGVVAALLDIYRPIVNTVWGGEWEALFGFTLLLWLIRTNR